MKRIAPIFLFLSLAITLVAEELDPKTVIERARATIGTEEKLDSVVTLRLVGALEPSDPKIPSGTVLIVARKPCSQRMEIRVDDIVETTILRGRRGCIIRTNLNAEGSQMRDLKGPELSRVRYSTRQFFNFYKADFKRGEQVEYKGIFSRFGQRAYKLSYSYKDGQKTVRYFSIEDDTLISTVAENGVESVGIGSQIIDGIKFPEQIEYYEGGRKLHTIVFNEIQVNKPLPAGIFDIPRGESKQPPVEP